MIIIEFNTYNCIHIFNALVYNSHISFDKDKIYFILIDRFHDGKERGSLKSCTRKKGYASEGELSSFYGGNLKGIIQKLAYIKQMGFTAIWLSPFFHNTEHAYHGYAIKDFLEVDPHFGSKEDLKELTIRAHFMGIKVYMDVIINHVGNVWNYLNNESFKYNQGLKYPMGKWSDDDYPKPNALRNELLYEKKGMIVNWDKYPELAEGDFFELKKFKLDESEEGLFLQNVLFEIYAYWIKEFDFDGFRIDTARHMSPLVVNRFTHRIKEFVRFLGKLEFPIFIEAPFLSDEQLLPYFTIQKDHQGNVYNPPDGFLDFFLHFDLPDYFLGKKGISKINERFRSINAIRKQSDSKMIQVTFLDNHDQVAEDFKQRISNKLNNLQLIKAWRFLIDSGTSPCLYYGTEQGLTGAGRHDKFIREAMFDKHYDSDLFDVQYTLYKSISRANSLGRYA